MSDRLYQISEDLFNKEILPIIEKHTTPIVGRPQKLVNIMFLCNTEDAKHISILEGEIALKNMVSGIRILAGLKNVMKMVYYG
ncbi:MAG: hypothetical protein MTP17_01655 [Candidatus Midichloria sp.]|nr:MAG: hypothetical protein MTP17_01655 [Candidatus Midichloria sp.]